MAGYYRYNRYKKRARRYYGQARVITRNVYRRGRTYAKKANHMLDGDMGAVLLPLLAGLLVKEKTTQGVALTALGFGLKNTTAKRLGLASLSESFLLPAVQKMVPIKPLFGSEDSFQVSGSSPEASVAQVKALLDNARLAGDSDGVNQLLGYLASSNSSDGLAGPADSNETFKI